MTKPSTTGLKQSQKAFVEELRLRNHTFYDTPVGRGSLKDLQQTFPHHWLYVAELIQNAIDANAKCIRVSVHASTQQVTFEHDGKAFNESDVEGICSRGLSTKGAGTVGFMGVGFKSIFKTFERVSISSDGWHFALEVAATKRPTFGDFQRGWVGAVLPNWIDNADPLSAGMTCRFVLSNRLSVPGSVSDDIQHVFGEKHLLLPILARRGLQSLEVDNQKWIFEQTNVACEDTSVSSWIVSAKAVPSQEQFNWIFFATSYQPTARAIKWFLEHRQINPTPEDENRVYGEARRPRQVEMFCSLNDEGEPVPPERGQAFALLPTGVDVCIGMHIQADWLLAISRQELMEIESNEWHEEILAQVPTIMRAYLSWLVQTIPTTEVNGPVKGFDILPDYSKSETELDRWFHGDDARTRLAQEMKKVSFLPTFEDDNKEFRFLKPSEARLLPNAISKAFDLHHSTQRILFGNNAIYRGAFSSRALQALDHLGLTSELIAADLVTLWGKGQVGIWQETLPADVQSPMLCKLLGALAELEQIPAWKEARLKCLPTAAGTWNDRSTLRIFPSDWGTLPAEPNMRQVLEPYVGNRSELLAWPLTAALQKPENWQARRYTSTLVASSLDDVVSAWWQGLSSSVSEEQIKEICGFTNWIKKSSRKDLVDKVLCTGPDGKMELSSIESALLAEPYAASARGKFFRGVSKIASIYMDIDSSSDVLDWRVFFESQSKCPKGTFRLELTATKKSETQLTASIGAQFRPPPLRSAKAVGSWNGFQIHSGCYYAIDAKLPRDALAILRNPSDDATLAGFQDWVLEAGSELSRRSNQKLAFFPAGSAYITSQQIALEATWIDELRKLAWIYDKDKKGPFKPSQLLDSSDPTRPNASVADLKEDLIVLLQGFGITFGSDIPNAPAIDRLRVNGPMADAGELVELIREAISASSKSPENQAFLRNVLCELPIFPVPTTVGVTVDGLSRIPLGRIVQDSRGKSELGGWVVSISSFPVGTDERDLLDLVHQYMPFAAVISLEQIVCFLSWVWKTQPEAEKVRHALPYAYRYLLEYLENGEQGLAQRLASDAKVFTSTSRRWLSLKDHVVYFDDLRLFRPGKVRKGIELVSAGHLGHNEEEQSRTVDLLRIRRISSQYKVSVTHKGLVPAPNHWQVNFESVQSWLAKRVKGNSDGELEDDSVSSFRTLKLGHCSEIEEMLSDNSVLIETRHPRAFLSNDLILVVGNPPEFATALGKILVDTWGLSEKRNLVTELMEIGLALSQLDSQQFQLDSEEDAKLAEAAESVEPKRLPEESHSDIRHPLPVSDTSEPVNVDHEPDIQVSSPAPTESDPLLDTNDEIPGGTYSSTARESLLDWYVKKRQEIERRIANLAAVGLVDPHESESIEGDTSVTRAEFRSDEVYRTEVCKYERQHGRWPLEKGSTQGGHDIDSYTHPVGDPLRKMIRRIEVKGRSTKWEGEETVELSARQFRDALSMEGEEDSLRTESFDYWLYVVEKSEGNAYKVLPIRNPSLAARKFELRGGTWRHCAEDDNEGDE